MKILCKHLRRLAFALFTFVVGVGLSPVNFYVQGWGCGKVNDGGGFFGVTIFKSSYFIHLWFARASYSSREKADDVFNKHLSEAVQVFEIGPKINKEGAIVGRRAMALFSNPERSYYEVEIFWTDNRRVYYIYSTSALHVREFEKHQR